MATPQVPPRPARSAQAVTEPDTSTLVPQIPPRPAGRRHDRSVSPERDRYAPSPLNAPFLSRSIPAPNDPYNGNGGRASGSNLDLPHRPPSVNLPSIGQEGNEYESYSEYEAEPLSRTVSAMSAAQTSHVGTDLPLHAPKPGLSQSEARARVQGVTNTDNATPSSPGARRLSAHFDDKDGQHRSLRSRSSAQFRPPSAASTERPGSALPEDHGIPQIGVHVPMYRQAGDVQAPSPAQYHSPYAQEAGGKPRHHNRTRSGRDQSNPPDSYGRHGHGVVAIDKFEKDWYAKHPEAFAQEGHYSHLLNGPRREYVLSSEELNKLVRGSASGAGFGTAPNIAGLPDEQIGYIASEEYASRMSSRPGSSYSNLASPGVTQTKFETALRKSISKDGTLTDKGYEMSRTTTNDSEIIHVDAPEHHWSKVTGEGVSTPPVDLGPHGGNSSEHGGFLDEKGYGIPILASDEVRPESAWQRPAISPIPHDRQGNADLRNHFGSHPESAGHSRPGSRPGSIHGMANLSRFVSTEDLGVHTPLDDVEEYEPLFGDDETVQKPVTEATRLKHRPDMRHRFPSQDIWEDSPESARLETEVDEPEQEEEATSPTATKSAAFESPEQESARKGEVTEAERQKLLSREERLATSDFKPQIRRDLRRPGNHRFPSSDIWEDSPDSARLETTVGDSEEEDENPAETAGAIVQTSSDRGDLSGSTSRDGATAGGPVIPARPSKSSKLPSTVPKEHSHLSEVYTASAESTQLPVAEIQRSTVETRKAPSIPDRPKPSIPSRPNRSDATSPTDEAASPKVKPPVPARPVGGKIAALQAGFMSDLNNRLKLGPQAPPKPAESDRSEDEPEEDKQPLSDARKTRAKGPARRKPATSPAVEPPKGRKMPKLSFAKPVTVWHISPKGALDVVYETPEPPSEDAIKHQTTTITEKALDSSDDNHIASPVVSTKSAENPTIPAHVSPHEVSAEAKFTRDSHEPSNDSEQNVGVKPLPASSGPGNPISLPAGETLPPQIQSINDKVTLSQESYENTGPGSDPPQASSTSNYVDNAGQSNIPAQTGIKSIEINPGTAGSQKLTVIEGGHALTGEDVVIQAGVPKDDEGHIRKDLA